MGHQSSKTPATGQQKQLLLTSLYQVLSNTTEGSSNIKNKQQLLDTLTFLPYNDYTLLLKQLQTQHHDDGNCTLTQLIDLFDNTTISDIIDFTATLLTFLALLNTPNKLSKKDNKQAYSTDNTDTHGCTDKHSAIHDIVNEHMTSDTHKEHIQSSKANNDTQNDIQAIWQSTEPHNQVADNNHNAHNLADDLLSTAKSLHYLTAQFKQPVEEYKSGEHFSEMDDEDDESKPATTNQLTQAFTSILIKDLGPILKSQRTVELQAPNLSIKSPHIQPLPLLRLSSVPIQQLDLLSVRGTSSPYILPLPTSSPKQCNMLPSPVQPISPMLRAVSLRKQSITLNDSLHAIQPIQLQPSYWSAAPCDLYIKLCGQSMIQCDIRQYERGQLTIDAMSELLQSDVVFTELETAIVNEQYQHKTVVNSARNNNPMFFHAAEPCVLDILQECQFNIVEAANNHVGDLGDAGLLSMLHELRTRNISYAGIGENLALASSYNYIETKPHTPQCTTTYKIAHIAFASKVPAGTEALENRMGVHTLSMTDTNEQTLDGIDTLRIWSTLTLARQQCDIVIAYHHNHYWERKAVNEEGKVMGWRLEFARRCIDFGASMYIAHGAPRLQGIEIYKGCPIFYCLGNFMFQTKTAVSFYGAEVWQSVVVDIQYHANSRHHMNHIPNNNTTNKTQNDKLKLRTVNPASQKNSDRLFTSYTIKLIPIVLNEIGDTDCHLQTRGLPSKAEYNDAITILQRLQVLSAEFGTIITIDDTDHDNVVGYIVDGKTSDISIDAFESHVMQKSLNKQTGQLSKPLARPQSYGGDLLTQQLSDLLPKHNNTTTYDTDSQVDSYGRFMNTYKQFKNTLKQSQSQQKLNEQVQHNNDAKQPDFSK